MQHMQNIHKYAIYAEIYQICKNIPYKDCCIYIRNKASYAVGPPRPAKTHTGSVLILHVFTFKCGICKNNWVCAYVKGVCPYAACLCIWSRTIIVMITSTHASCRAQNRGGDISSPACNQLAVLSI